MGHGAAPRKSRTTSTQAEDQQEQSGAGHPLLVRVMVATQRAALRPQDLAVRHLHR